MSGRHHTVLQSGLDLGKDFLHSLVIIIMRIKYHLMGEIHCFCIFFAYRLTVDIKSGTYLVGMDILICRKSRCYASGVDIDFIGYLLISLTVCVDISESCAKQTHILYVFLINSPDIK